MSAASPTPFHDVHDFVALPRVSGLSLSPDGTRLVAPVSQLSADRKRWISALWEIDPEGTSGPRRLTRSVLGEGDHAFLPDGDLLFASERDDPGGHPDGTGEAHSKSALWLLPADGGEARQIASHPGGVQTVAAARAAGTIVFSAPVMPGAADTAGDEQRRRNRAEAGVTAILHEDYPVRYWDHDLGPAQLRLFATEAPDPASEGSPEPQDLTPEPGRALDERHFELTLDGSLVISDWYISDGGAEARRTEIVAIDSRTGQRRVLAGDPDDDFSDPAISPDGTRVVCVRERHSSYEDPPDRTLWVLNLDGTGGRDLTPDLDLWPAGAVWSPDGASLYTVADESGRRPIFRVHVQSGEVSRLTSDHGAYTALCPAPDGRYLYAVRGAVDEPHTPVRLDVGAGEQEPARLPAPGSVSVPPALPGRLSEVTTTADDGQMLRAWLVLPEDADRQGAPLLVWIHGGPLASWNDWHWRWNPWTMTAHGYAVLLPDPALSTGYGLQFVRRGWGSWGDRPYTDLMALTDAAIKRTDIDETRTAAMGGSFGGYMANWIAGHTDRFQAIVTHASLWALDQMKSTTDVAPDARREFGDPDGTGRERITANSPHRHAANIRTPMLVIHGDRDYRVPIGEALRLWWDLTRYEVEAKFLYFPDQNHWVLNPAEAALWYETILAFLDHHVRGEPWRRPALL